MGRPVGSKNKKQSVILQVDEVIDEWLNQQEKTLQTVPSVKPPKKRGLPEATDETILELKGVETSLFGSQCASPATIRVSGFINIQANPRGGWYSGCDIHETVEKAKAVASKQTITQVFIAFEVKA